MRKKILSGILVLAMMLTMIPTAFAEDTGAAGKEDNKTEWVDGSECKDEKCTHEAAIGNKHYSTLEKALEAVTSDTATTIKLLANAEVDSTINVGIAATEEKSAAVAQKITLDLNGKTLTSKASGGAAVSLCVEGSSFTLIGGGELVAATCEGIEVLKDKCSVTIGKGVTVSADNFPVEVYPGDSDISSAQENWVATIAIYGTIVNTKSNPKSSDGAGVYTSGNWKTVNVTIGEGAHITGAKKDGAYVTEAVYAAAGGTLTVNGGYMEGNNGIYAKGANVIINGGKIVGSAAAAKHECKDGGTIGSGDGVVIDNCKGINNYQTGSVTIKGGEISGTKNAVAAYAKESAELPTVTITGGTFSTDPRMQYEVENNELVANEDATEFIDFISYTVIPSDNKTFIVEKLTEKNAVAKLVYGGSSMLLTADTFEAMFWGTVSSATTMTMLKNYTVQSESVLSLSPDMTFDGNGKTITGNMVLKNGVTLKNVTVNGTVTVEDDAAATIESGVYQGNVNVAAESEVDAQTEVTYGKLTIKNGTFEGKVNATAIENGTFHNSVTANVIENGKFAGTVTANTIKGGLFMVKPEADAIAEGYRLTTIANSTYAYTVEEYKAPENVTASVNTKAKVDETASEKFVESITSGENGMNENEAKAIVESVANTEVAEDDLKTVAEDVALGNKTTVEQATTALKNAKIDVDKDTEVTVHVQTSVEVKPVSYTVEKQSDDSEKKTLTVDIKVVATTIAATTDNASALTEKNSVTVGKETVTVTKPVTVRIPLPTGFAKKDTRIYVTHKGIEHECTVQETEDSSLYIEFTNKHGFSEFTLSTTSESVVKIDDVTYTTYADVIKAARNGDTITITKLTGEIIDLRKADSSVKTLYVAADTGIALYLSNFNYSGFTYEVSNTGVYKFTRTSSGSYVPTIPGNVPGSTIVTPGKTEDNTENDLSMSYDDAVAYVATMKDMSEGAWYYDMVVSAVQKGIIRGTGNAFSPDKSMTLYETLTVLARFDGEGIDGASWLEDAKAWALDNEILTKAEDESDISRERLVYLLYTYAKKTGVDVSAKGDLSKFTDAADVSDWAVEAMTWAVGEGIINGMYDELKPADTTTRAQVSTVLVRYADVIAD